jgi:soluble lytic murein transglycosylase
MNFSFINKIYLFLFFVLIFLADKAQAEKIAIKTNKGLQETFILAEKHLWQSDSDTFKKLYEQLENYPLRPYLDQKILLNNIKLSHEQAIDDFLKKYQGTPLDWPLRKKWLSYLAKKEKSDLFVKYYRPNNIAALNCQHLSSQIEIGLPASIALPKVTDLWLVGKSQTKKCDNLFEQWQEAGYRTDDIVWQRIGLAADGGKHTLIPYLTRLLPEQEKYLGALWHKVRRDPAYVSRLSRFPHKTPKEAEIMIYGLQRLIWRNPSLALKTYKKAATAFNFTEQQEQKIIEKFAVALASKNHNDARSWLVQVDSAALTKSMIQWRLTEIIERQDWQRLISELVGLPEQYKRALQWKYWYARALIETGEQNRGENLLSQLANERHYYGFLAASYLKQPANLQDRPLNISANEKELVLRSPAAKRAFELFYLKRFNQARREWNYWLSNLNKRQKLVAAKVANEAQWFDRAIFTLSKVGYLDDVSLRFPMAYDDNIIQQSEKHKINPAWAFAIARRESSFMSDAHSPVGAKGLMQLMPRTAKQVGRKKVSNKELLDTNKNIKLGTKYLKLLLDKNNGNAVLATASYNAGPYRVRTWLKNKPSLPADIWIETIPYKETRDYVKSVLAYQQIYQIRSGQQSSVFEQVTNMMIGSAE